MNFVINLDKPKGLSSQQAVTKVKRKLGVKRAGHSGTLDPLATGVLLVCTGEATKITRFLSDLDKEYIAVVKLGEKTDTYDSEGKVIEKCEDFSFGREEIEAVLAGFRGMIEQTPPMYSAVKINGRPLYKLARKGLTIERPKRTVSVYGIEMTGFELPLLELKISCSKGTYIRSLCNDIGEALGVGAHITELRRTRIGDCRIEDSVTLEGLEAIDYQSPSPPSPPLKGGDFKESPRPLEEKGVPGKSKIFRGRGRVRERGISGAISIDDALRHLGEIALTEEQFLRARNGLPFRHQAPGFPPDGFLRLKDPSGRLFAVGRISDGIIKIERMLHI